MILLWDNSLRLVAAYHVAGGDPQIHRAYIVRFYTPNDKADFDSFRCQSPFVSFLPSLCGFSPN